jgi:mitochondrial chaperone BCS1
MYSLIAHLSRTLAQKPLQAYTASLSNLTTEGTTPNFPAINDLASLWAFLSSFGAVHDWIKLFLLGTVLETIRRFAGQIWSSCLESFFLTATFESDDDACE